MPGERHHHVTTLGETLEIIRVLKREGFVSSTHLDACQNDLRKGFARNAEGALLDPAVSARLAGLLDRTKVNVLRNGPIGRKTMGIGSFWAGK